MGAAVGTEGKGSVNVELNIVPFIDLMSCLVAFLLFSAVWVEIAQINIQPKGKTRDTPQEKIDDERVTLSILIQAERIYVGLSRVNEFQEIPKLASGEHDWDKLKQVLDTHKKSTFFADREDLEIAGESTLTTPVKYQDIITAMDIALLVGFKDVGLTDPKGLAAPPTL